MDDLYREVIIDRFKNPQFRGELDPHDLFFEDDHPLCGDHIQITLRVGDDEKVTEALFDGKGCSISQATADLLLEEVVGKSISEIKEMTNDDIIDLLGIELGPVRLKCALLSMKVLKGAVYELPAEDI